MKIFKIGKYPQGDFSKKDLEGMIANLNSVPGILGHTSGWRELKVPSQAIPRAAEFSNLRVQGDYIEADVALTEFGKKFVSGGAIKDISVEISKENNKILRIGMLGAVPPQIKDLDTLQSLEFSDTDVESLIIEFSEGEGEKKVELQQILDALGSIPLEGRLQIVKSIGNGITQDEKKTFRALTYEFSEMNIDDVREFAQKNDITIIEKPNETKEQMEARLRAEIKQETLLNEFSEKSKIKVIPAMQNKVNFIAKELIKSTATEVEFSENEKGDLYSAFTELILGKETVLPDANLEFGEITNNEKGSATKTAEVMWGQN
jgi:hypothetical protein